MTLILGISWYTYSDHTSKPTRHHLTKNTRNIALMLFGEPRTYDHHLDSNLTKLKSLFQFDKIDVYILTQLHKSHLKSERSIKNIFRKHGADVVVYDYWNHEPDKIKKEDDFYGQKYDKGTKDAEWGKQGRNHFVGNYWYRRHLLNEKRLNSEKTYEWVVVCRLYDVIYDIHQELDFLQKTPISNHLYCSPDHFYAGDSNSITTFLKNILYIPYAIPKDIINEKEWRELVLRIDRNFVSGSDHWARYASEVQSVWAMKQANISFNLITCDPLIHDPCYITIELDKHRK